MILEDIRETWCASSDVITVLCDAVQIDTHRRVRPRTQPSQLHWLRGPTVSKLSGQQKRHLCSLCVRSLSYTVAVQLSNLDEWAAQASISASHLE